MNRVRRIAPLVALALASATTVGCTDFLSSGNLTEDPNRPTPSNVSALQLFEGTQANLWSELNSDPARLATMWTQQMRGANAQYTNLYNYGVSEATTNGFHQALYAGGGLVDIRELEKKSQAAGDSLFYGIAQVTEAALIGTGADLFGDIVYSNALAGPNPAPDHQLAVYDAVQVKLDSAIAMMAPSVAGTAGATNAGPGGADLSYNGDPELWTKLAYTLKARFYLHTAEVRGTEAYASALAAAEKGLTSASENYNAVFSGIPGQQNHWYQFVVVQRPGYIRPNAGFVSLLTTRNDPRIDLYFNAARNNLSSTLLAPDYTQPLVTAYENLLIWAEAAYRTGDQATALQKLNAERALWSAQGISLPPIAAAGTALLTEILTEKYIALFESFEPWNDYKRTCWPNVAPTVEGGIVPARLFYDIGERQTDTALLPPDQQPLRNENDPANATDPTNVACQAQ